MAGFIADASVTLPWCFEDEASTWTESLLDRLGRRESITVPAHWPIEVANALLMAMRRGRVTLAKIEGFVEDLQSLAIHIEPPLAPSRWLELLAFAAKHKLTVYDAAYLDLANRTRLPLATLDEQLVSAALRENTPLLARS